MTKNESANSAEAIRKLSLCGPPPLLEWEDSTAYDELLIRISGSLKPTDSIEEIWLRDFIDLTWEIIRWRRVKADLILQAVPSTLRDVLAPHTRQRSLSNTGYKSPPRSFYKLIKNWANGDPAAISKVEKLLGLANLTMESVVDRAFAKEFEKIERFDRLIATCESRRNTILREIDRHRTVLGQILRARVRDIEDSEFEMIETKAVVNKNAMVKNET